MKQTGFTLIEVLISIAILAFIMVAVWSSTSQSLDAKDRIEKRDGIFQEGRVSLRKLSDDLEMAFLIKDPRARAAEAVAAGVAASTEVATRPRPISFFIAEDRGERDELRFTTLSHLRLFKNAKESEQSKVSYAVAQSPEDPNVLNLVRTYYPWLDDKDTVEGTSYVVAENVREFNVEYYDTRKQEWVRSWNTMQLDWKDRLPRAVRVTLAFPDPDDDRESIVMRTAVMLPMSGGTLDF